MNLFKKLFSRRKEEVQAPPPEFLQDSPPDWLLVLNGQGVPPGQAFSIRAQLFKDSRKGSAEMIVLPKNNSEQPLELASELARLDIDKLFVILGFSFPDDVHDIESSSEDGIPVNLTVHRREPFTLKQGQCNLEDWVGTKQSKPPTIEIALVLVETFKHSLSK